ncbi:MAG: DUF4381 family protein, partial [Marinicella sp.]
WWVLITVLLLLVIWLSVKWYKYRQKKNRWIEIDEQLSQLEFDYRQSKDSQKFLTDVSTFLRRFIKFQIQHDSATSLAGNAWINYLNQYSKSGSFADFEAALTVGVFQADYEYDANQLLKTTRLFIKQQVMKPETVLEPGHV